MSKANRRRQRPGNQPPTNRPTGSPSSGQATPNGAPAARPRPGPGCLAASASAASASGSARSGRGAPPSHLPSDRHGCRPSSTAARHGRRERQRTTYQPSFMERYRTAIIIGAAWLVSPFC